MTIIKLARNLLSKIPRRRLVDGVAFISLMILFGCFAKILHIDFTAAGRGEHLILQVQAWLNGHMDLAARPNGDTVTINGKYYLIFPPLPALLITPFYFVLRERFNDIWFTWIFAALNIILLFRTLEIMRVRAITRRTPIENGILAFVFGFGTIALWLCLGGSVWFTAQTISMTGIMITLHGTLCKRWTLAFLGAGMVLLTRSSEALIVVFPILAYLYDPSMGTASQRRWKFLPQRWPSIKEITFFSLPLLTAVCILLVRNQLIFGNILSTGYDIQNKQFYPQIKYGVLDWHYIWPNFAVDFLRWPNIHFNSPFDTRPHVDLVSDYMGTSMFFSTPLLAIFFFAPQGKTPQPWLRRILWITTALSLLTILLFCASGWQQVGARYIFPLYPLLFLLLAQREASIDVRWIGLAGASVFINLLLARVFWNRSSPFTKWFALECASAVLVACVVALLLLYWEKRRQQRNIKESSPSASNAEELATVS